MHHPSANPICRLASDPADRSAWEAVVVAYGPLCWRIALRMLGDEDAAADAVQDALLAIRSAAGRFRAGDDPNRAAVAWVARVVVNTCHHHLRRQHSAVPYPADLAAPTESTSGIAEETLQHLRTAIAELPATLREAVALRYLAGLDPAAVATSLGIAPGAARVRLHRAVEVLRAGLARRGVALSAVVLAGMLDGWAEAACPPLPAATAATLAATPLPPVAVASWTFATWSATTWAGIASALVAGIAAVVGGIALAQPVTPPATTVAVPVAEPAVAAVAAAAAVTAGAAQPWEVLFADPTLRGWIAGRGTWQLADGIVRGVASDTKGARLHSAARFGDGELTCRLRVGGGLGRQGEIQVDDYRLFFAVPVDPEHWFDIRLEQRGQEVICHADGKQLEPEVGEPGPQT